MAVPARKIEQEIFMEERVARLEASVEHIQSDISEMKTDIRRIDAKVDDVKSSVAALRTETKDSIASQRIETRDLIGALRDEMHKGFAALKVSAALDKVWWLLIAATLLGVMAKGFKWI